MRFFKLFTLFSFILALYACSEQPSDKAEDALHPSLSELPEISRFDPVASLMALRPGEIIEIIRPSPISIINKYYRLCC